MFRQSQELDRIIAECSDALNKNPKNLKAFISRAFAYGEKHEYDKAIKDLTKAIELCPEDRNLYYNRACHYLIDKNANRKAIRDFTKVIKLNPHDSAAYTNRGIAYAKTGNYEEARKDFNKALEYEPDNVDIRKYCAVAYFEIGDFDSALKQLSKLQTQDPEDAEVYYYIGLASIKKGNEGVGVDNLKLSADYGNSEALMELKKLGIQYTPQKRVDKQKRTYWGKL